MKRVMPIEVAHLLRLLKVSRSNERPYIVAVPLDGEVHFISLTAHSITVVTARDEASARSIGWDGEEGFFDLATKAEGLIRVPESLMQGMMMPHLKEVFDSLERPRVSTSVVYGTAALAAFLTKAGLCIDVLSCRRTLQAALVFEADAYRVKGDGYRPDALLLGGDVTVGTSSFSWRVFLYPTDTDEVSLRQLDDGEQND